MKINFVQEYKSPSGDFIKSIYTTDGSIPHPSEELPLIHSVRELREFLAFLPDDLPINGAFGDCIQPVWYNLGKEDEHMQFDDDPETDDDDDYFDDDDDLDEDEDEEMDDEDEDDDWDDDEDEDLEDED